MSLGENFDIIEEVKNHFEEQEEVMSEAEKISMEILNVCRDGAAQYFILKHTNKVKNMEEFVDWYETDPEDLLKTLKETTEKEMVGDDQMGMLARLQMGVTKEEFKNISFTKKSLALKEVKLKILEYTNEFAEGILLKGWFNLYD